MTTTYHDFTHRCFSQWGSTRETETTCFKEALREILKKIQCRDLVLCGIELKQEKVKQPETNNRRCCWTPGRRVTEAGSTAGSPAGSVPWACFSCSGNRHGACRESDRLSWRMWHCPKLPLVRLSQEQRQRLASLLL